MQESGAPKVRLMFQDEAGFGRINKPKYCWSIKGQRPSVPCHHIREYRYVYGAIEPLTGEGHFLIMPNCDSGCMNVFLSTLSKIYRGSASGTGWRRWKTADQPFSARSRPDSASPVLLPGSRAGQGIRFTRFLPPPSRRRPRAAAGSRGYTGTCIPARRQMRPFPKRRRQHRSGRHPA